ncbi:hypothetical protein AYO44_17285 [Planctomycetaceae bacterium SCGC AG-212-F19]|nr:hypothetical protein AYO44_17285 [Planctomycetaceae bacterium SCGC AG-212-F19]
MQKGGVLNESYLVGIQSEGLSHQPRHMGHTYGMVEPGVDRTGINEVSQGKLVDAAQPLQSARPNQLHLLFSQGDKVVHRIADVYFHDSRRKSD